jgi:predicted aldo/keto reductase-like oxidoreductase
MEDIEMIFGPGGAIEAFIDAKEKGMTRFIGVTGHQDPKIIRQCIERFHFDTVLLPINPAEPTYKSFIDEILPLANEREMGIIAMKVYFRGFAERIPGYTGMEPFYRFALSHPITTAVIGCDDLPQLEENSEFAWSFMPMKDEEMQDLKDLVAPHARQLMYYKQ